MRKRWQDGAMLALGAWLLLSPLVLGYAGAPAAAHNAHLVGAAVILLALVAFLRPAPWTGWGQLVLGIWVMISAFALAGAAAWWNLVIVGALIVLHGLAAVFMRAAPPRRHTVN